MMEFGELLKRIVDGAALTGEEACAAMNAVMDGQVSPVRLAAFLVGLRVRGETGAEIAGFARSMREHAVKLRAPAGAIDTCGTGGDGSRTFNVSTLAALVAAGAGVPVAKHGNRSVSSSSGSADLLEKLGLKVDCAPATAQRCLDQANFCFMFAPLYHPAMKHAMPVRKELGLRTVFNLLGPLTNPAGVRRQVMGVYAPELVRPICEALGALGAERAMVVHSVDGLDEVSPAAPTRFAEWREGAVREGQLRPEDFGLEPIPPGALRVDSPDAAARVAREVLAGRDCPARQAVLANTAVALAVAGRAADFREGVRLARASLDGGKAREVLERAAELSRG
jgi:anthranilate phosphoribosyltransferase